MKAVASGHGESLLVRPNKRQQTHYCQFFSCKRQDTQIWVKNSKKRNPTFHENTTKTHTCLKFYGCCVILFVFRSCFKSISVRVSQLPCQMTMWCENNKRMRGMGERGRERNNWNATSQSQLTNNTSGSHLCAHTHWINVNLAIVADRHHIASKKQQKTRQIKTSWDVCRAEHVRRTSHRYSRIPVNFKKNAVAHLVAFAACKSNTADIYVFLIYVIYFLRHELRLHHGLQKVAHWTAVESVSLQMCTFKGSTGWCLIAAKQPNSRALQQTNQQDH